MPKTKETKQEKTIESETISEEELKPIYHYAESVEVSKIVLETAKNNENDIKRIRFETHIGNITYKPKKLKTQVKNKKAFAIETEMQDVYTLEDLEVEFPVLMELAISLKKKPQTVVISYVEKPFFNEREKEVETYFYMIDSQIHTLYFYDFHKDNKENLVKQKENQKKYVEKEL